jgi:hypothetical protein
MNREDQELSTLEVSDELHEFLKKCTRAVQGMLMAGQDIDEEHGVHCVLQGILMGCIHIVEGKTYQDRVAIIQHAAYIAGEAYNMQCTMQGLEQKN